jgi:hypothetical protein
VFLAGWNPDDIARTDLLDRAALTLGATATRGDDQGLAERMRMPVRARARLEGDAGAANPGGRGRFEERIDPNRAGKPIGVSFAGWL